MTNETLSADSEPTKPRMLIGVAWVLGFRIFDRIAGIASVMILARLLVPEHFGLVALGTSVAAFVELLGALSLDAVLIQKKDATRDDFDTAWTIQVAIGAVCASLLAIVSPFAADFFRQPALEQIIQVLAAAMLVDGFTNIRIIEFRKLMRFDKEFVFMATRRLLTTSVTIASAFILRNHWALVIGIASGKAIGVILGYAMRPYRPRFTLASKGELLHASWWLFFGNTVQFVRVRLSDFVLGRTSAPAVVGAFNLANEISTMVSTEVVAPVNRVALPEFSAIGNARGIADKFNQLTGQLAIFLIPMGVGLLACAKPLVAVFFGPNWSMAAEVLGILACAGLVAGLGSNIGVALLAVGRFKDNAMLQAVGAALLIPLLITGAALFSYRGAAFAMLIANAVLVCIAVVVLKRAIGYSISDFLSCLWRPLFAAIAMYAAVYPFVVHDEWFGGSARVLQLATIVGVGAPTYALVLLGMFVIRGRRDLPELTTLRLLTSVWNKLAGKLGLRN